MRKEIRLDELQTIKFENLTLKQKLLEKEQLDLQTQQAEVVKSVFPEFNGQHQCGINFKDRILTITSDEEEIKKEFKEEFKQEVN